MLSRRNLILSLSVSVVLSGGQELLFGSLAFANGNGRGENAGGGNGSRGGNPGGNGRTNKPSSPGSDKLSVQHPDGIREQIVGGIYTMFDRQGRQIVRRKATNRDRTRLRALLR
jgi:hypothetical protein